MASVCVCVFTSAQHRQNEQHQVSLAAGAEHAGKHQEDRTSAEGGPGGGQHTPSWNTQEMCECVSGVCVCVTCVRLLTYKEDSCRQPKVRGQRESVGHAQEQS